MTPTLPLAMMILAASPVLATEGDAYVAAKTLEVEIMRMRLAAAPPNPALSAAMQDVDDLLRRVRQGGPGESEALRAPLDAALARLELELAMAASAPSGTGP
ncbi:MAG: hypothetical protein NVV74_00045 [Magnetospirillum sp.]|nr:hypothetical protein [Magnetospirillum sp.]